MALPAAPHPKARQPGDIGPGNTPNSQRPQSSRGGLVQTTLTVTYGLLYVGSSAKHSPYFSSPITHNAQFNKSPLLGCRN